MTGSTPRLRMFAGPNGSGKSTLKSILPAELLGIYLNPDEIEAKIRHEGILSIAEFGVVPDVDMDDKCRTCFTESTFLRASGLSNDAEKIRSINGRIDFSNVSMNSYFASVVADFLRQQLLKQKTSFTLETVMSSRDKVELLAQAQQLGYRTYLYYIATDDPAINVFRVRLRVKEGGHSVPEDKIVSRYYRSLDLLIDAIHLTNRSFIFDNSSHEQRSTLIAEITDGHDLAIKVDRIPHWFAKAVLDKNDAESAKP